jgi:hypothetical protein
MIFEKHETYDMIKLIALLVVPIGTLIAALLNIWGLPYAQQITATAAAIDVFLGTVVKISSDAYKEAHK